MIEADKVMKNELQQDKREKVPEKCLVKTEEDIKNNLFKAFKWDIIREKRRIMLNKLNKLKYRSNRAR
jgi:hypothetical protein